MVAAPRQEARRRGWQRWQRQLAGSAAAVAAAGRQRNGSGHGLCSRLSATVHRRGGDEDTGGDINGGGTYINQQSTECIDGNGNGNGDDNDNGNKGDGGGGSTAAAPRRRQPAWWWCRQLGESAGLLATPARRRRRQRQRGGGSAAAVVASLVAVVAALALGQRASCESQL